MAVDNFSTIINFTMLQGFLGIKPVDGAYWTLRYELHFYVIIAIILLFKQTNRVNKISFVWILCLITYHASATVIKDNIVMSLINIGIMAEYAHLFIIGVAICGIIKNAKDYCLWLNIILALCTRLLKSWIKHIFYFRSCSVIFLYY